MLMHQAFDDHKLMLWGPNPVKNTFESQISHSLSFSFQDAEDDSAQSNQTVREIEDPQPLRTPLRTSGQYLEQADTSSSM
jgi:hypothetical protein